MSYHPPTAVTPGSYTSANVTMDKYGNLTAAANGSGGTGTVTTVSVVTANGVSGSVANPTTTPAITLTLGAITPSSVASPGAVTGSNLSSIVASADLTGQTAAVASVATYTPGADGTYRVAVYTTITAIAVDVLNVQVDYTDETNTARTQTFVPVGLTSANLSAVGASVFPTMDIRVKSGNAITIKTVLAVGGGSITYDVGGTIEKLR